MTRARDLSKLADGTEFTAADHSKLDAIEASATADQTDAEIRAAVEAATDSNVFTDADHSKLNAIEASSDVTDTANVTAAGALMDSELTNLAAVKAINQSLVTTASPTFAGLNTTSELITKGGISIDSGSSAGPEFSRSLAQNLKVRGSSGGDVGITVFNSANAWCFNLYGGPSSYGYLDGDWGDWDIQKYPNGKLELNGNTTYYLQPETTSKLNNVQVGGIDFGTSGATDETLSSYEEGTFTPTLPQGGTVGTVRYAKYTRVGNLVVAGLYADLTPTNNSSGFHIGGLPFVVPTEGYGTGTIAYSPSKDVRTWGVLVNTGSSPYVYFYTIDGNNSQVLNSYMNGSPITLILWVTYRVNA